MIDMSGIAAKFSSRPATLTRPNSRAPIGASAISAQIVAAHERARAPTISHLAPDADSRRRRVRAGATGTRREAVVTMATVAPNDRTKPGSRTVSGALTAAHAPATARALSAVPRWSSARAAR